jgi:adenylate cyclase
MAIPIECERRFLVANDGWRCDADGAQIIRQGYLTSSDGLTVRVRLVGEQAFLTIKTPHHGISRAEFEYEIPLDHGSFLIEKACPPQTLEKIRHEVQVEGFSWTVDEFSGLNHGLILAEIELDHADHPLPLPSWIGAEVTSATQFHNSYLSRHPYSQWGSEHREAAETWIRKARLGKTACPI